MKKNRKDKILIITALFTAILSLSVGFAAFSTTLNISSSASVLPNSDTFSVKFSTEKDRLVVEAVVASNKTTDLVTTNGVINNSASPIISNLSATFTEPGQFAEYTFYARNEGEYTAYLNSINFIEPKTCTADGDTTLSLVNSACDSISMTITMGENTYTETTEISNHSLAKKTGEKILVKLNYDENGARADGPFSVNFGNITMIYSTIDAPNYVPLINIPEDNGITWSKTSGGKIVSSEGEVVEIGVTTYTTEQVLENLGIEVQDEKYNGNWVVLGLEGKKLKLVSQTNLGANVTLGNEDPTVNMSEIEEVYDSQYNETTNLNLEKAIWSWNHAIETLDNAAKAQTGIASARSLKIEDLEAEEVLNITEEIKIINSNEKYGKTYKYFLNYNEDGEPRIYSQNIKVDNPNVDDSEESWSEIFGGSFPVFVNADKTIIDGTDANKNNVVKLESTSYLYKFTSEQRTKFSNILVPKITQEFWLASLYREGMKDYANCCVRRVDFDSIRGCNLLDSDGYYGSFSYGIRAVVII